MSMGRRARQRIAGVGAALSLLAAASVAAAAILIVVLLESHSATGVLHALDTRVLAAADQGPQGAGGPRTPSQDPLALVHANVVNVRTGTIARDTTVVLRAGRIESIGQTAPPTGVRVLDVRGRFLVPGLIDAHTHLTDLAGARYALESGVTTARGAGVSSYADVGIRELARKGAIAGPELLAVGYHVRPRLAEEAFLNDPSLSSLMAGVTTIEQIRQAVRMNLSHGVDWIKVMATERAGTADTDPRKQVYSEDELRAVVEEAATKQVPVLAHAHGDEGARAAVRAGVRSIEHGTYLSDTTLALMKEKGTFLVPTYAVVTDMLEPGGDYDVPALQIRARHMLPRLAETIQRAHAMGVKIGAGSDTRYAYGSLTRVSQELDYYVTFGFTPLQALQAATLVNAELLGREKSIGVLEPGFEADIVAVDRDPLTNIRVLQDPLLVISNGRVAVDRLDFGRPATAPPSASR
jgi:imidazolonepropionase-like amidohydrolase